MKRIIHTMLPLFLCAGMLHAAKKSAPQDRVPVDLYVMSLCPYGVQAENGLLPVAKALNSYVDLRLHFIAGLVKDSTAPVPTFQSLHGPAEVDENIRQVCVGKIAPDKLFDYVLERNKNVRAPDWQSVAKTVKVDPAAVEKCISSGEGAKLLTENIKAAEERKANGSPTIDVAGKPYSGARSQRAFAESLCGVLKGKNVVPDVCKDLSKFPGDAGGSASQPGCGDNGAANAPAPVPFGITILAEKNCSLCGPTLEDSMKRQHPAATIKTVDAASPEGLVLVRKYHVQTLPFYILEKGVEKDPSFLSLLDQFYAKAGDGYVVKSGQNTFRPDVQLARTRRPDHLDLFVSPLSGFSAQAELEFMRYLKTADLKKDVTLSFHFVMQESVKAREAAPAAKGEARSASLAEAKQAPQAGDLMGGRGDDEVKEATLQACLFQHAPVSDFLGYLDCRNQNLNDSARAQACLQATEAVTACVKNGEGENLLRKDAALVRDLDVNTSVSVFWENRYGPYGWNEVDWKKLVSK